MRAEVKYCYEQGIPHSTFVRWRPDDKAKALAFMTEEALRCPGCGTQRWEWDERAGGSRFAYHPEVEICPGCERKEWARSDGAKGDRPGLYVVLKPAGAT